MRVKDKVGNEIKVGCFIVYGHALGRCAGLRIGKVLRINMREPPKFVANQDPDPSFTVMSVNDMVGFPIGLMHKKGTLYFPSRIIVLEPNQVPEAYKALLDPVEVLE